jgi:hypothetical protein
MKDLKQKLYEYYHSDDWHVHMRSDNVISDLRAVEQELHGKPFCLDLSDKFVLHFNLKLSRLARFKAWRRTIKYGMMWYGVAPLRRPPSAAYIMLMKMGGAKMGGARFYRAPPLWKVGEGMYIRDIKPELTAYSSRDDLVPDLLVYNYVKNHISQSWLAKRGSADNLILLVALLAQFLFLMYIAIPYLRTWIGKCPQLQ